MDIRPLSFLLFIIFSLLIVGDGPVAPLVLQTGTFLVMLAAIIWYRGALLAICENDRTLRRFIFLVIVFVLLIACISPATNPFAFYTGGLRVAVAGVFFMLLLFCVRTAPWSGLAILRWYVFLAAGAAAWALLNFFVSGESRLTANWANPSLFGAMLIPALLHTLCRPGDWPRPRRLLAALFSAALILTYSRGLIVALVLALPALWWLNRPPAAGNGRSRAGQEPAPPATNRPLVTLFIVILLIIHFAIGATRWTATGGDPQSFGRLDIWRAVGEIIIAHPWQGVGFSALGDFMPPHKFPSQRDPFRWGQIANEAHNEYLNFAAECGLPALGLALYLLALLLRVLATAHEAPPGLRLAIVVWLLHAGVDNLAHFLPTLLLFALLLALTLPAAWRAPRPVMYPRPARGLALLITGLALALSVPPLIGETQFVAGRQAEERGELDSALACYESAAAWSPLAGLYHMHAGGIFLRWAKVTPPDEAALVAARFNAGAGHFQSAITLEPNNPLFRAQLARVCLLAGRPWLAEEHLRYAISLDPTDVVHRRRLATLLQLRGNPAGARAALRQAITLEPLYADGYHDLAQLDTRPFWRIMAVMAHRSSWRYLQHLLETDTTETSIYRYVAHLQELPDAAYQALTDTRPAAAIAGDSLALWPPAAG